MARKPHTGKTAPLRIFISAGETSGDLLGAGLMRALSEATGGNVAFTGVGGPRMVEAGLEPLYPMADISVMGFFPVIRRSGTLIRRWRQSLRAILARDLDALIIIDLQEFHHLLARAVRKRRPDLAIIDYVPPTVWAWRPGRARAMRAYITHSLALFPFEPDYHRKLGGPGCSYVGHPLVARLDDMRRDDSALRAGENKTILVLPGSRISEIDKMMPVFAAAALQISARIPDCRFVLPAPDTVIAAVRRHAVNWPVPVEIVTGEAAKLAAMKKASAALTKSGTITLELALARVPMAVGYILDWFSACFTWLVTAPSITLPNLIIGRNGIPEFIHKDCTADVLAQTVIALLHETPQRAAQMRIFDEVAEKMRVGKRTPSQRAARQVLAVLKHIPLK